MALKIPDDVSDIPGAYVIMNKTATKVYIGSTGALKTRLHIHRRQLNSGSHGNLSLQKLCDDEDGDLFVVLFSCNSRTQAYELEQKLLDDKERKWELCNIATDALRPGLGVTVSAETKRKISESKIGKRLSDDVYRRMAETKRKNGVRLSADHIERLRTSLIGKPKTNEHRFRISQGKKGQGGYPVEIDGVRYNSGTEAAEVFGIDKGTVFRRAANPRFPTWKKLT